jgi:integrase
MNRAKTITKGDAQLIRGALSLQDRLIFDFSIETGLRISDILQIKAGSLKQKMTIWESKTDKTKTVELSDGLFSMLKSKILLGHNDFAFHSPRRLSKPLHRSTYHRRLKRASKSVCVEFSAHSARKLYARNIFEQTGDIFAVQKALNHKYVTTTCDYLDINLGELIRKGVKT